MRYYQKLALLHSQGLIPEIYTTNSENFQKYQQPLTKTSKKSQSQLIDPSLE